jgi:hypothetical protein
LPIGENGAIESFEGGVDNILGNFVEYFLLFGVHVECLVERKRASFFLIVNISVFGGLRDEKLGFIIFPIEIWIDAIIY